MGVAINYIDDSLVGYLPGTPQFTQLALNTLGDYATPADGMDADIAAMFATIPATEQMLADLDATQSDVYNAADVFSAIDVDSLVDDYVNSIPVISQFTADLSMQTVGTLQLPAPSPPAPVPPQLPTPVTCYPSPSPAPEQPAPAPAPTAPTPAQNCPSGFVYSTTGCQPSEPPVEAPPIVPPDLPQPQPTLCPDGFAPSASGYCQPTTIIPTFPVPISEIPTPATGCFDPFTFDWDPGCLPPTSINFPCINPLTELGVGYEGSDVQFCE